MPPGLSIQIGISEKTKEWVEEWILTTENASEKARKMKRIPNAGDLIGKSWLRENNA